MITTSAIAATVCTTVTATIVAATIATSVASTASKRTLEARTRIAAADARGITRSEFFTRRACGTRRASLAGKEDRIVFLRRMCRGFAGSRDRLGLKLAFVMIDRVAVLVAFVAAMRAAFGGLDGFVMSGIGFDVGAFGRAQRANLFGGFGFFHGIIGDFDLVDSVDFFSFLLVLLFVFFFVFECSTADNGIRGRVSLHFILFCFDDAGGERSDFFIAQRGFGGDFVASIGAITFEFVS
jgi:hypothetical protein